MRRLMVEDYAVDAVTAAKAFVGAWLCRRLEDGTLVRRRITETEAYCGEEDTACHAHKGRTPRTDVMYSVGGCAYIYLCYGIHEMLNVVTGHEGRPEAVLVRGVEGAEGPGRLTKLFKIDRSLNREDLVVSERLWIESDGCRVKFIASPRIGIGYASKRDQSRKWRFVLRGINRIRVGFRATYKTPRGFSDLMMLSDGEVLTGLHFVDSRKVAENCRDCAERDLPVFRETSRWLDEYFAGHQPDFMPPYRIDGLTPFRKDVIDALLKIPFGKTITYGDIAAGIARKRGLSTMSAQAVGGAVGWNPICILIPCHRVIGTNGALVGYGGGIRNKVGLLSLEGSLRLRPSSDGTVNFTCDKTAGYGRIPPS